MLASIVGTAVTVALALVTATPAVFLSLGALASTMVWVVTVGRYGGRPGRPRRSTLAVIGVLLAVAVSVSVLLPITDPAIPPTQPPGAGVWTLADGTQLAYGVVHAHPATGAPVVVLHGEPGVPGLAGQLTALRDLTADGHDVYAYAQLGAGSSSRLADPRGYTVARAVTDLEEVRQRIGARDLILIGHSYGAFLAAAYLADHPDRVARLVVTSPGDLSDGLSGAALQARLGWRERLQLYALVARPRLLLSYALLQANPAAAHAFAGDGELDPRMARVYAATIPALHCPGRTGPVLHGVGFYANQVPQSWHRPPVPDIRPQLRTVDIPALVMKGQCDYLDWHSAAAYVTTLPRAELAYLPGAGHDLYLDRPAVYLATIRAFLAGRPIPHLLASPTTAPADYQHYR